MGNTFNKVVLAVHAHPDDTEAFCSGTLALLKKAGYKIVIATMTAGDLGGVNTPTDETCRLRKAEAAEAAKVLDAEYYCLGQPDGYVFDNPQIRKDVLSLIRKVKAGIVMTHLPDDYHADHRATCAIVDAAAMIATLPFAPVPEPPLDITPLFYHTAPLGFSNPLGQEIIPPHFFIDITDVIDEKMQMLSCHQTQIELMQVMHKIDDFFGEMKLYNEDLGKIAGVKYAECMWQHLGGGFQKDPLIQDELAKYIKIKK